MSATESELRDPALVGEVDLARAAAQEEAGDEEVGAHVGTHIEADTAVTHLFETVKPGYHGWRWAVTVASAGPDTDVTISEVVLLPGPEALVAPDWVPWENRVQAGDLGVGDLLPTAPDDPRLVPAYVESDDPAVEEVALDVGLGRPRVMARPARLDAATRWQHSEFGPRSDMARGAPAHCGTCGFYLPLAGSLRVAFGTCGNEISPADGHVVHTEYGCGAHSEAEVEQVSPVLVANLIYDDALLDVEPLALPDAAAETATDADTEAAEADATEGLGEAELPTEAPSTEATAEASPTESSAAVGAIAAPRELSGPRPAAEQLPFPAQDGPLAAEPVAPIEAVVTAETVIDAPGEAGSRPEGAAQQPPSDTDAPTEAEAPTRGNVDHGTPTETEASDGGGLLTGGLLDGGLLRGGLLRNSHALTESGTPDQGNAATTDQPDERDATGEDEDPARAEDLAPSGTEAPDQTGTPSETATPGRGQGAAEAPEGTATASGTEGPGQSHTPGDVDASDHGRAPGDADAPDAGDTETQSRSRAVDDTEPANQGGTPTDEAPDHSQTADDSEVADQTPGDTATPGLSDVAGETPAEEHHPWQPSFRPYWMRSADERRTEGD